jgi:hypothetical protein
VQTTEVADHGLDVPARLRRALATWDIQAHRTLAAHSTPANLVLAARTQSLVASATLCLLQGADQANG